MTEWLVRKNASGVRVNPKENSITILSKSRPRFRRKDGVILAEGSGKNLIFSETSTIVAVEYPETAPLGEARETKIALDEWKPLKQDTTLDLLQFSLKCVWNFDRPDLHFRRAYRKLPAPDIRTIAAGEPFILRTAYYSLLKSLPPRIQELFERELKDSTDRPHARVSLEDRFRKLFRFIDDRILSVGKLLKHLHVLISEYDSLRQVDGVNLIHQFATEQTLIAGSTLNPPNDDVIAQANAFQELEHLMISFATTQQLLPEERTPIRLLQCIEAVRSFPGQATFAEVFKYG